MTNSLANRQFLALIRGEAPVRTPSNPFRVAAVAEQERYCLRCCDKRHFDVIYGKTAANIGHWKVSSMVFEKAAICRSCGHVLAHPSLAKVRWVGG